MTFTSPCFSNFKAITATFFQINSHFPTSRPQISLSSPIKSITISNHFSHRKTAPTEIQHHIDFLTHSFFFLPQFFFPLSHTIARSNKILIRGVKWEYSALCCTVQWKKIDDEEVEDENEEKNCSMSETQQQHPTSNEWERKW